MKRSDGFIVFGGFIAFLLAIVAVYWNYTDQLVTVLILLPKSLGVALFLSLAIHVCIYMMTRRYYAIRTTITFKKPESLPIYVSAGVFLVIYCGLFFFFRLTAPSSAFVLYFFAYVIAVQIYYEQGDLPWWRRLLQSFPFFSTDNYMSDLVKKRVTADIQLPEGVDDEKRDSLMRNCRSRVVRFTNTANLLCSMGLFIVAYLFADILDFERFDLKFCLVLVLMRTVLRSFEILYAFFNDALGSRPKTTDLNYAQRVGLAVKSLVELTLLYAVIYAYLWNQDLIFGLFTSIGVSTFTQISFSLTNISYNLVVAGHTVTVAVLVLFTFARYLGDLLRDRA